MPHYNQKLTIKQEKNIVDRYLKGEAGYKISKDYPVSSGTIYNIIERHNVERRSNKINSRKYEYDRSFFKKIDTPKKAYWLGFIYADGYIAGKPENRRFGIALAKKDESQLIKFKNDISATYKIHEYEPLEDAYSDNNYCRIEICGKEIYNILKSHGVFPKKTDILKAPKIKDCFKSHFIRGYFDGDGSIYSCLRNEKTNYHEYVVKIVGTIDILDYIKDFIEKNNIAKINKYYQRKKGNNAYSIELSGNIQVKNFLDLIYKNSKTFLDRKYKKYKELSKRYKNSRVN